MERAGIRLVSVLDPEYPSNLRMIHQRPPVLFLRGTIDAHDETSVAVVGTRMASPRGLDQARELGVGLAALDIPVISGFAAGIDTAAHTAAVGAGGRTVAVIGTGKTDVDVRVRSQLKTRLAALLCAFLASMRRTSRTRLTCPHSTSSRRSLGRESALGSIHSPASWARSSGKPEVDSSRCSPSPPVPPRCRTPQCGASARTSARNLAVSSCSSRIRSRRAAGGRSSR